MGFTYWQISITEIRNVIHKGFSFQQKGWVILVFIPKHGNGCFMNLVIFVFCRAKTHPNPLYLVHCFSVNRTHSCGRGHRYFAKKKVLCKRVSCLRLCWDNYKKEICFQSCTVFSYVKNKLLWVRLQKFEPALLSCGELGFLCVSHRPFICWQ